MAGSRPTEFPSLDDVRLPSTPEDKDLLKELKLAWDQYSDKWDEETKREFVDHILKGYTKVTKTNHAQPSGHRLWKAGHMTFAVWIIFRVTYDEDKLSKPREWLRCRYKNIDPQSWVSPDYKNSRKLKGTQGEWRSSSKKNLGSDETSQATKPPQSAEAMEICDNESDYEDSHDGYSDYVDDPVYKAIARRRFKAVNVPEPDGDSSRKRGSSNASANYRPKLRKTDSPMTSLSTEADPPFKAPSQPTAPAGNGQACPSPSTSRSRPLKWQTKLQELRDARIPGRGLHRSRPALNRTASTGDSTGDQASLPPNPTVASFTQTAHDQNAFHSSVSPSRQWVRSQERSSRLNAPVISYEKKANDQSVSSDPIGTHVPPIQTHGHSTQTDHVRAKFGLADHRSDESGASDQRLPWSPKYRDNTPSMAPQGSSDPFVFSSSSYGKEQPNTGDPIPLRLTNRETLEGPQPVTPGNVFTQQPSGLQQLPLNDPDEPLWFQQFRRDMKQILNNIVDTSRVQLESSQKEGAAIQGLLLPAITEHRKDSDDLVQRATSIEERTSEVEEYLELQLADKDGDSARNAQVNENDHHTFGNHENAGGD
ncbi:hypothetical protein LZL87_011341 [Fusarium oxysporum]|nr:hypothetical protein LZL87_011341 [Fusarium oxysporum]